MSRSSGLIALFLIFSNVSCASIAVRMGCYSRRLPVYPATAIDIGVVSYTVSAPFRSQYGGDAQDGIVYFLAPSALVDFPLAVAVDTALLPYDIYKLRKKQHNGDAESTNKRIPKFRRDDDSGLIPYTPERELPEAVQAPKQNDSGTTLPNKS